MRTRASGLAFAAAVLLASLVQAQAPPPAQGIAATPREVDPGVFNTSPVIDRAELRAGRLEIKPGGTRRVHQHDDVLYHLFVPLTGSVQLTVGADTINAVPGQVYFINRGTPHGFKNTSGSTATAVELFLKPPAQRPAAAQNELFLEVWELNLTKSSITRGAPPQLETVVNVAESGGFRSTLAGVTARSTSVEIHHYVFDGDFHQTEGADPRELSFKRIDQRTIESDTRRNGQITVNRRFALADDGKTMTVTASGTTGGGQKYTNDVRIYDKK